MVTQPARTLPATQPLPATPRAGSSPDLPLQGRSGPRPSVLRVGVVYLGGLAGAAALFALAAWLPDTWWGRLASVGLGLATTLLIASLAEWAIHRGIMHRPSRLPLLHAAFALHHRAHHWVQFPPTEYKHEGQVQYLATVPPRLEQVSRGAWQRTLAVGTLLVFYGAFAAALAVVPAWSLTGNVAFSLAVTATSAALVVLFVHIHDAVHYPGLSPFERMGWFRFLDHHHYVHHIDTQANTNFLLPLGDVLLGTLRLELTEREAERWPSYEQALAARTRPRFDEQGRRLSGGGEG
jgi:hypothetical protein